VGAVTRAQLSRTFQQESFRAFVTATSTTCRVPKVHERSNLIGLQLATRRSSGPRPAAEYRSLRRDDPETWSVRIVSRRIGYAERVRLRPSLHSPSPRLLGNLHPSVGVLPYRSCRSRCALPGTISTTLPVSTTLPKVTTTVPVSTTIPKITTTIPNVTTTIPKVTTTVPKVTTTVSEGHNHRSQGTTTLPKVTRPPLRQLGRRCRPRRPPSAVPLGGSNTAGAVRSSGSSAAARCPQIAVVGKRRSPTGRRLRGSVHCVAGKLADRSAPVTRLGTVRRFCRCTDRRHTGRDSPFQAPPPSARSVHRRPGLSPLPSRRVVHRARTRGTKPLPLQRTVHGTQLDPGTYQIGLRSKRGRLLRVTVAIVDAPAACPSAVGYAQEAERLRIRRAALASFPGFDNANRPIDAQSAPDGAQPQRFDLPHHVRRRRRSLRRETLSRRSTRTPLAIGAVWASPCSCSRGWRSHKLRCPDGRAADLLAREAQPRSLFAGSRKSAAHTSAGSSCALA
jgi:hypothetical protein